MVKGFDFTLCHAVYRTSLRLNAQSQFPRERVELFLMDTRSSQFFHEPVAQNLRTYFKELASVLEHDLFWNNEYVWV